MINLIKSPYGKVFYIIQQMAKENVITIPQKGLLKDLLIQEDETTIPMIKFIREEDQEQEDSNASSKKIELFLLNILEGPPKSQSNHAAQQEISRIHSVLNIRSRSHSWSFNGKKATGRTIKDYDCTNNLKDDSVIEYSVLSEEANLLKRTQSKKNEMTNSLNHSLNLKDSEGSHEEEDNEFEDGSFNDYYKNIKDEFNLPSIKDLQKMQSSEVFMTRSSM